MEKNPFSFILKNEREKKPRKKGITEIRGPYSRSWEKIT